MTNPPAPFEIAYATPSPYGNAPILVKLAGIFLLVIAGLDFIYGVVIAIMGFAMGVDVAHDASPPPMALFVGIFGGLTLLSLSVCAVKITAGVKLLRRRYHAWGWGLAGGIICCMQLWCSYFCVIPMAAGIFTIIVLCQQSVIRYLREGSATGGAEIAIQGVNG